MATVAPKATEVAEQPTAGLKKNALGLSGAMIVGVVIMAPSLGIFGNWGPMVPSVGKATGAVFLIALLISLPTAYSYVLINNRMATAGATYKWASRLINPYVGVATGLCTTLFYALIIPYNLGFTGLLGSDLARSTSTGFFAVVMVLALLVTIPLIYRNVNVNIDASLILVGLEVVILTTIVIVAFIKSNHSHASLAPLNPGNIPSVSALVPALVLGVLSFTGYDAISTVGEETRTPRKLIPKATMLAVIGVGLFWIVISLILSDTQPASTYIKVVNGGGFALGPTATAAFGSAGRDVLDIMGLEAGISLLIACTIGATRILYAMGRDGAINGRFGTVHPKFQVPWLGITAVLVFTVVSYAGAALIKGINFDASLWLSNLVVFFALITYLVINVCNPLLYLRHHRREFHWFSNGLVPVAGLAVTGYFLYKGFFQVLWNSADFNSGRLIVLTGLGLLAATFVFAWIACSRPGAKEAARSEDVSTRLDADAPSAEDSREGIPA
jgi:putrescine importer